MAAQRLDADANITDEATRKFLQGLKRLLTFVQRAHPADPSRCVEFGGMGEDKAALLAQVRATWAWRAARVLRRRLRRGWARWRG
jgi:hypothetical protein